MAINRKSFERVAFYTPTAGTGPFEVGTVVSSTMFLPSEVGMVDTDRVGYLIVGSGDVELGWTEASAGVTEFSRNVVRSKIGGVVSTSAKMDLQGTETVRFVDLSDIMIAAANAFDSTTEDADDIDEGSTHLFLTGAERTKVGHLTVTGAVNLDNMNTRINDLDAAVILRGVWAASGGSFPGGGTAQAGSSWIVSVAGTVNSVSFNVGDRIIAITDNASTTTFAANWFKADYTDQVSSVASLTGAITASGLVGAIKASTAQFLASSSALAIAVGEFWAAGTEVTITPPSVASMTVTFTNGSSSITATNHGLAVGAATHLTNAGGGLPTNFAANTEYYVVSVPDANTITVSATRGGSAISAGSAGSGTHTLHKRITIDFSLGLNFTISLPAVSATFTMAKPYNHKPGQVGRIRWIQPASSGPALRVYPSSSNWVADGGASTIAVLSTANNAKDVEYYDVLTSTEVLVAKTPLKALAA